MQMTSVITNKLFTDYIAKCHRMIPTLSENEIAEIDRLAEVEGNETDKLLLLCRIGLVQMTVPVKIKGYRCDLMSIVDKSLNMILVNHPIDQTKVTRDDIKFFDDEDLVLMADRIRTIQKKSAALPKNSDEQVDNASNVDPVGSSKEVVSSQEINPNKVAVLSNSVAPPKSSNPVHSSNAASSNAAAQPAQQQVSPNEDHDLMRDPANWDAPQKPKTASSPAPQTGLDSLINLFQTYADNNSRAKPHTEAKHNYALRVIEILKGSSGILGMSHWRSGETRSDYSYEKRIQDLQEMVRKARRLDETNLGEIAKMIEDHAIPGLQKLISLQNGQAENNGAKNDKKEEKSMPVSISAAVAAPAQQSPLAAVASPAQLPPPVATTPAQQAPSRVGQSLYGSHGINPDVKIDRTFNIAVIGQSADDVEPLINRFVDNKFVEPPYFNMCDYSKKIFLTNKDGVDKNIEYRIVHLMFNKNIHSSHLNRKEGFLIVVDMKNDLATIINQLDNQISLANQYNNDPCLIIVGINSDCAEKKITKEQLIALATTTSPIPCTFADAKSGNGVGETFQLLIDMIYDKKCRPQPPAPSQQSIPFPRKEERNCRIM